MEREKGGRKGKEVGKEGREGEEGKVGKKKWWAGRLSVVGHFLQYKMYITYTCDAFCTGWRNICMDFTFFTTFRNGISML